MSLPERIYTVSLQLASVALPLVARGGGKIGRGARQRRGVVERMEAWAARERDAGRPLVWFHASSVGEGLQARATIEAFRARRPEVQIVYTYFSPSAEAFAARLPLDFVDVLPLDVPAGLRRALDALRPSVIVFSKTDVWPNLTREADRRGVPMALLSGTLPASSSQLRGPARAFLAPAYRRLRHVGAISEEDSARFARLGVPASRRSVMGDARFDQVVAQAVPSTRSEALVGPFRDSGRPTVVAGSTWPPDEIRLLEALQEEGLASGSCRLMLAPHEPTDDHLARFEALVDRHGLRVARLSSVEAGQPAPAVLLVDRLGILGDLYALADVAYVGGGFGTAGLHSVLEPAAFGAPVIFGPHHSKARDAKGLLVAGGAFAVADTADLRRRLALLLKDEGARAAAGAAARDYVESGTGAAERGAEIVEGLLGNGEQGTGTSQGTDAEVP
jgi:3-deoxy-D-manno-octulosonic-acid transferase